MSKIMSQKEFEECGKDRTRLNQIYALLLAIRTALDQKPKPSKSGGK